MTPIKAVLFDWGETLVHIPGMIHSPERHLGCLERLFEECAGENSGPSLRDLGVSWPSLRTAYIKACRKHMAHSATTRREHRFEDRFGNNIKALANRTIARDGCAVAMGGSVRRIDCARCGNGGRR
jgi:hypothetical protein